MATFAVDAPPWTVTEDGAAIGPLVERLTTTPPAGALALNDTVQVAVSPLFIEAGLQDRLERTALLIRPTATVPPVPETLKDPPERSTPMVFPSPIFTALEA